MITVPFWLKYRIACIILSSAASWVSGMIWSQIVDAGQVDAKKVPHQQVENQKPQADTAKAIIVDGVVVSRSEYSAIWRMNEHRKRRGLQPLKVSQDLMNGSRAWAQAQAKTNRMHHDLRYVQQTGHGENCAWGQSTGVEVADDWMQSNGHRAAIMRFNPGQVGVGCARGKDGRLFWCARFSR